MDDYDKKYRYDSPGFKFQTVEKCQSTKPNKVISFQESIEVKNEHIYQQLINDMYEKIENGECFKLKEIEKLLMKNMLVKYNRANCAKLMGVCVRTLRNKINEYGYQNLRIDNSYMP